MLNWLDVGEQTTNHDVKSLGLDLFQQWALTYTTKDELTYLVESYHSLKHSGASPSPVLLLLRPPSPHIHLHERESRAKLIQNPCIQPEPTQASPSPLLHPQPPSPQPQPSPLPPPFHPGKTPPSAHAAGPPFHLQTENTTVETAVASSIRLARGRRWRYLGLA